MKEYLINNNGEYELHKGGIVPNGAVEVPEGAEIAIKFKNDLDNHGVCFYKNNGKSVWSERDPKWDHDSEWNNADLLNEDFMEDDIELSHYVLWSRFTKPEELPFVDDEPMTEENQIPVDATEIMNKFRAGNIKLDFSQSTGISGLDRPQPDLSDIQLNLTPKHSHYFKDVSDIDEIDVYEVLHRFGVTDPCLQHIVKKALCAGERGHKDFHTDLKNIADTAQRMLEIHGL